MPPQVITLIFERNVLVEGSSTQLSAVVFGVKFALALVKSAMGHSSEKRLRGRWIEAGELAKRLELSLDLELPLDAGDEGQAAIFLSGRRTGTLGADRRVASRAPCPVLLPICKIDHFLAVRAGLDVGFPPPLIAPAVDVRQVSAVVRVGSSDHESHGSTRLTA